MKTLPSRRSSSLGRQGQGQHEQLPDEVQPVTCNSILSRRDNLLTWKDPVSDLGVVTGTASGAHRTQQNFSFSVLPTFSVTRTSP